jgi:hypothetical protein
MGTQLGRIDGAEQLVGLDPRSSAERLTGPIDVGGQLGQDVPPRFEPDTRSDAADRLRR